MANFEKNHLQWLKKNFTNFYDKKAPEKISCSLLLVNMKRPMENTHGLQSLPIYTEISLASQKREKASNKLEVKYIEWFMDGFENLISFFNGALVIAWRISCLKFHQIISDSQNKAYDFTVPFFFCLFFIPIKLWRG